MKRLRACNKTASEKGTDPFCSADSAKLGQSPAVLLHARRKAARIALPELELLTPQIPPFMIEVLGKFCVASCFVTGR